MDWDGLRSQYKPSRVKVLLVGESVPAGGTFFFAGNSKLFQATKNVFERILDRRFKDTESFLRYFRSKGFFLEDLCPPPVNRLSSSERSRLRKDSIRSMDSRLQTLRPKAVIIVMKAIRKPVLAAMSAAGLQDTPSFVLSFPAFSHSRSYEAGLLKSLRALERQGIFRADR